MDATPLYDLVEQLDGCAAALRTRADVINLRIGTTQWYSTAGRLGLGRVEAAAAQLAAAADRLDGIVASVRTLAAAVASRP